MDVRNDWFASVSTNAISLTAGRGGEAGHARCFALLLPIPQASLTRGFSSVGATDDGDAGEGGSDVLSHSIGRAKFFIVPPVRNNSSASFLLLLFQ